MNRRFSSYGLALACLLFVAGMPASSICLAQDCSVELEPRLDTQEPEGSVTNMQYKVDVSVEVNCARLTYDLVLEVRLPNGHVKKVRMPRVIKLSDGRLTDVVRYKLGEGSSVLGYEAKLVDCQTCEMGN